MSPRIEDVAEPVIGRMYDVPAIVWNSGHRPIWSDDECPIIGPVHNDREVIGFEEEHWHIDWRFVRFHAWKAAVIHRVGPRHAHVVKASFTTNVVERRRMLCKRSHEEFPFIDGTWMARLEGHYSGAVSKCSICPHRGISLAGAPVVDGARVCPGHGLAWDVETGRLRPRQKGQLQLV